MSQTQWTFLSNHGHVLVSLAKDPHARMRDVAGAVGITERAVQQIVRDLVMEGYLSKEKVGRRNRYSVIRGTHFRHALEAQLSLAEFLNLVVARDGRRPLREPASSAEPRALADTPRGATSTSDLA